VIGEPLHPDRLLRWPGWRAGGMHSAQPQDLFGWQRVGPGAQQRSSLQVEQQQGARFDHPDSDLPAGQEVAYPRCAGSLEVESCNLGKIIVILTRHSRITFGSDCRREFPGIGQ
jgi:hypothetical protein